jgi:hypothetical protein
VSAYLGFEGFAVQKMLTKDSFVCLVLDLGMKEKAMSAYLRFEGFAVTLYGAEMGKQKGAKCQFDPECASNTCIPFDNKEGTRFTCS